MTTLITLIQNLIDDFVCYVETGIVLFANLVLTALGAIVSGLLSLLPSMPTLPSTPTWVTNGYHYVAYWFPVDWAMALAISFITLYLGWLAVSYVMRWARLLSGSA